MTREAKQTFTRRITQANRTQLVVILYDMVMAYLDDASDASEDGDEHEFTKALQCARGCIAELRNSLDFSYDLSRGLFAIYAFADRELAGDIFGRKCDNIEAIGQMFGKLRDAYHTISQADDTEPLMHNAQDVYAGFTYGRSGINENMLHGAARRGFCV